jgi:hypothetical protein
VRLWVNITTDDGELLERVPVETEVSEHFPAARRAMQIVDAIGEHFEIPEE